MQGIGMNNKHLMLNSNQNFQPVNKLHGEGDVISAKHVEAQNRLTMINYLTEKIKN